MPTRLSHLGLLAAALATATAHADTVWLRPPSGGELYAVEGTIADYTGEALTLVQPTGRPKRYPAERVARIETVYTAPHVAGRQLLEMKKWIDAASRLVAASREESRKWARRQALADLMRSYAALGQTKQAGDLMIALASSDPATPAWSEAPLPWFASDAISVSDARAWLARSEDSARLLGAAWLLGTSDRAIAMTELRTLTRSERPSIARLAEAQLWRLDLQRADDAQVDRWASRVQSLPAILRPGPRHLLAQAYLRQKRYDEAALAALEAPLTGAGSYRLAARSLLLAARSLQKAGHHDEADKLLGEIIQDYADTPWRQDAQSLRKQS